MSKLNVIITGYIFIIAFSWVKSEGRITTILFSNGYRGKGEFIRLLLEYGNTQYKNNIIKDKDWADHKGNNTHLLVNHFKKNFIIQDRFLI